MVRKLVRTLVSLSLATPLSVWGLGLGDIHLHSALNEKLNAEIDLLSVEEGDMESIEVELASYDAFQRVGIERVGTLALLDFVVEKGPDGKPYVRVTSKQAIREPFLDFLIAVDWRYGKLLREYTLLLDPPEIAKGRAPATTAPTASEPAITAEPAKAQPASIGGDDGARVYGPVKVDDTLWSIAKRLRKDSGVSIKQMMIALFRANPEAFLDNNINKLRKGAVLRLDDPAMARALNQAEAAREVARQSQSWARMKGALAEQGARRSQETVPAAPPSSVATREKAKLKLVAPEGEASEPGGKSESGDAGLEAVKKELMLALETAETQRRENDELRKRLQELEGQLASMQRLVSLKSDDMAQLQGQLAEGEADKAKPDEKGEDQQPAPVEPEGDTAVAGKSAEKPVQTAQVPKPEPEKQVKPEPKPKPKAKPKPAPKPEPVQVGLVDQILSNPYMVGGLGIGIVLLGLFAIVIRRRMSGGGFQESILTGGTSSMLNAKGEGDSSMETSLLSDLTDDGMGGMPAEDSEVDPITEADVYMAYGRHQQAEELLKDAIEQEPERHELLVKLMEIYYKTKNKNAFETQAEAARSALEGSGPLWDKIAVMGHELAPDNDLFSEAPENVEPVAAKEEESVAGIDDVLDIGLDLDALAAEMEPSEEYGSDNKASRASDGELDLDLDLGMDLPDLDEDEPAKGGADSGASQARESENDTSDFDDLDFGIDLEEGSEQAPESRAEGADPLGELDFGATTESDGEKVQSPASDEGMADLDFGLEDETAAASGEASDSKEPESDDLASLDFGLDSGEESPLEAPEVTGSAKDQGDGLDDLDFGFDETTESSEPRETETAVEETAAETGSEESGLEFSLDDFDLPQEQSETPAQSEEIEHEEGAVMDFDLGDFKLPDGGEAASESPADEIPSAGAPEADANQEADIDLDFGLDDESNDAAVPAADSVADEGLGELNLDLEDDFGDGLDEVGTKLDLATAYVEMGDGEGAREMLQEVLKEGDAEQQQRAQQLLEQISA